MSFTNTKKLGAYLWGASDNSRPPLDQRISAYEQWAGVSMGYGLDFGARDSWDNAMLPGWLTPGWKNQKWQPVFSIPLLPNNGSTLKQGASGSYDKWFTLLGQRLVSEGFSMSVVRLGWEMNGGWYPDSAAQDVASWISFWRRAVSLIKNSAPSVKIHWCPNIGWGQLPTEQCYPGDDYVDIIGCDVYDQSWISNFTDPVARWNDILNGSYGLKWFESFASQHNKSLAIGEWGITTRSDGHGGGDNPLFIENMLTWMESLNDKLLFSIYFDINMDDGHHQLSNAISGLSTSTNEFPKSATKFRDIIKTEQVPPITPPVTPPTLSETDTIAQALTLLRARITAWRSEGKTWTWIKQRSIWKAYAALGGK